MKNNWIKIAAVVAAVACLTGIANAVPVSGNIGFTGQANLNSSSVNTATQVSSWNNTTVNGDNGSFAGIAVNTPVTIASPWTFTSGAVASFWTVGGFTFDLIASSVQVQSGGFLAVTGTGTVSGNGFDATVMGWSFTAQDPSVSGPQTFTFSASASSIPDGGTTVMLLGLGLSGLALIKRKLLA